MQKKSVKKNRRRANQTRRRKSIMRGGNKGLLITILVTLVAVLSTLGPIEEKTPNYSGHSFGGPIEGGAPISIKLDIKGEIVDTTNVDEDKLKDTIELVKDRINLQSFTTKELEKQIAKITSENNINIKKEKNGILIQT